MEWLRNNYNAFPGRLFVNDLSYREVYEKVTVLAKKLASVTNKVTRVALYAGNSVETAIFLLALLLLKKEILLLNIHLTKEEVKRQIGKLGVELVFSSGKGYIPFQEIYSYRQNAIMLSWDIEPEQIAVIMNTSATTGEYKSVPIRWKQVVAHVRASARTLGIDEKDNWLLVLPFFHISGLSILLRSLYNGTRVTILDKFDEEAVLGLIRKKKVNMVSLTTTILGRMIDKMEEHSLRVALLGGEFIPVQLTRKCLDKRLPVYKTYGMTETTSQSTTFCILDAPDKLDSVGRPLPEVDIAIKNADEEGVGEICIKSPMMMDGYIGRETVGEYFNTGDIGYIDPDRFLYVLNRRSDIIISGGENIYPKEIEDLLYELQEVKECAVVGEKDNKWGQVPVLYIVSTLTEEEIQGYFLDRLAKYKIPKTIIYMDELPKNASGKILRKALQKEVMR